MVKTLPARADIPVEHTWDLTPVYATDEAWEHEYAGVAPLLEELVTYKGRLDNAQTLLEMLTLREIIGKRVGRLYVYAALRRDEDTTNAVYQAQTDRAQQLYVRASAAGSFVRPELLALPDGTLERFRQEEPGLELYAHMFDDLLREKPHVLSQAEETLLAQMGEIAAAPGNIHEMLTDADLKFGTVEDEEGEQVELTESRYTRLIRSHNRRVREEAFTKLFSTYQAFRNTTAATFSANVKGDVFYARARNYASAREAALHGDNIPLSVYDNLIAAVHDGLPQLHRYLALRKRVLKLDELHIYDLQVPLVQESADTFPYDEATRTVLAAISPMGRDYGAAAAGGFDSRWVDVYETPNKRSGAYSWGAYDTNPFILLNYQDTLRDVFTLAHELGHAMHSYYTRHTQPYIYGGYTTFVAEVASTLNEALLTDYLLKHDTDPMVRLSVVNNSLENFRGTLFRQTQLAEFEKLTHDAAEAGEALTADRLSEIYYDLNALYYGPGVVSDALIAVEWARIPHFYRSFYVFQYATGISAATTLAQQILSEGAPAVERYLRFLSRGSSAYSIELLKDAGVDMTSPQPVATALEVFGTYVDEMERLLIETGRLTPETAPTA
jgi:oligoendopeptidase F